MHMKLSRMAEVLISALFVFTAVAGFGENMYAGGKAHVFFDIESHPAFCCDTTIRYP